MANTVGKWEDILAVDLRPSAMLAMNLAKISVMNPTRTAKTKIPTRSIPAQHSFSESVSRPLCAKPSARS